jgi:DNA repair photolyase
MHERSDIEGPAPVLSKPGGARGRGALSNSVGRFEGWAREAFDDEWPDNDTEESKLNKLATVVFIEKSKSIISRNTSPDVPFDTSINAYRGCAHGCIYCFARPSHAYVGLSPGLDFETKLFVKENPHLLLEREITVTSYKPSVIAMGTNTDPYQPIEKENQSTRKILEVLERYDHPVTITTKSGMVMRDIPLLARMAQKNLVKVHISVTSLCNEISRTMEPRASAPRRRLEAIKALSEAGIPTGVIVAPVIPSLTDSEMEKILEAAVEAGATSAHYILLRLPREVESLFHEWLDTHHPLKAKHVRSLMGQMHGGNQYDSKFGIRMTGTGIFAETLRLRFQKAHKRLGLVSGRTQLSFEHFLKKISGGQESLF